MPNFWHLPINPILKIQKISFEYVDSYAKIFLILYPPFENSTTRIAIARMAVLGVWLLITANISNLFRGISCYDLPTFNDLIYLVKKFSFLTENKYSIWATGFVTGKRNVSVCSKIKKIYFFPILKKIQTR